MKSIYPHGKFSAAILFMMLAALVPANATSIKPISIESLTQRASLVVEARAEKSWAQWNSQHTLIYTYTRFAVGRELKGHSPTELVVRQMGGSAGGYTQHVAGIRHWQPQEEAVLFLRPSQDQDGSMSVVGLMQGNFAVSRLPNGDVVASNGVPEVEIYNSGQPAPQSYSGASMRLSYLEQRILRAAQP